MNKLKPPGAFTLIELLIVVAIIGILAAIAVPNFMNAILRAKIAKSQTSLNVYQSIQQMYLLDCGDIPGHYHGEKEQCPYINLGYISEPLTDPLIQRDLWYDLVGRTIHSGYNEGWSVEQQQSVAPTFTRQWVRAGMPYYIYGHGPGEVHNWMDLNLWLCPYDSTNGLRSNGCFLKLRVKGKGDLGEGLTNRNCN